ncbi:MAG: hypothetical protein K2L48_05380 [Mycoplasmoidaceae bacterium]|nr:hypothetical protein [Mycoplasmoidaceae bacterium]
MVNVLDASKPEPILSKVDVGIEVNELFCNSILFTRAYEGFSSAFALSELNERS